LRVIEDSKKAVDKNLFFLWTGATCASFNLAGKVDHVIARFTIFVKGFVITGLAKCKSFGEIPSIPVAFFALILLIRLPTNSYRPASVLPAISKIFENSLEIQLVKYFDEIFNPFFGNL
jgi:hypothetical protein